MAANLLGDLRAVSVRCLAIPVEGRRCRIKTNNPNACCGRHQHLTNLRRFTWVQSLDDSGPVLAKASLSPSQEDFHLGRVEEIPAFKHDTEAIMISAIESYEEAEIDV